ncbi:hypothetical protein CEXT_42741 [Caerostris extrusa]|uniref:Uncharacterized protein n=1 Tax=Caerostris extrusa TaxID=172846 RepID=A0AAV4R0G4_CAEEX|nr:hypothetical protein CEXT_42741 [Caerostris extrusa]
MALRHASNAIGGIGIAVGNGIWRNIGICRKWPSDMPEKQSESEHMWSAAFTCLSLPNQKLLEIEEHFSATLVNSPVSQSKKKLSKETAQNIYVNSETQFQCDAIMITSEGGF